MDWTVKDGKELGGAFSALWLGPSGNSASKVRMDRWSGNLPIEELAREQIIFEKVGLRSYCDVGAATFPLKKTKKLFLNAFVL